MSVETPIIFYMNMTMKNGSSRNDTTPFSMSCVEVYELNVCFFLFNVQMAKKDMIQLTELYD